MKLSIIIPTYNEAENIERLVKYLHLHGNNELAEIIISDGGGSDDTIALAQKAGAIAMVSPQKGRAAQMNYGAGLATGDVLYFIHADTFPPTSFVKDIEDATLAGYGFGRYYSKYDTKKWLLKINEWFTRSDWFIGYGGDQTLFISKPLFGTINGFDTALKIMEDYDITIRAKKLARYKVMPKAALISARKYDKNSWWKVLMANRLIVKMYKQGATQDAMVKRYKELLNY